MKVCARGIPMSHNLRKFVPVKSFLEVPFFAVYLFSGQQFFEAGVNAREKIAVSSHQFIRDGSVTFFLFSFIFLVLVLRQMG